MSIKTIEVWENEEVNIIVDKIISAEYGNNDSNPISDLGGIANGILGGEMGFKKMVDVSDKVRTHIKNDIQLNFIVTNDNLGCDPFPGIRKKVIIKYTEPEIKKEIKEENKEIDLSLDGAADIGNIANQAVAGIVQPKMLAAAIYHPW
tara:strand:- start:86 stop:529 length:444 start_codon:yes stop_codon:yes gene_type:complete